MIPKPDKQCLPGISNDEILATWLPYQNILRRIVKKHAQMSFEQKIRLDVENFIYRMLSLNSHNENKAYKMVRLGDLASFQIAFPEEYQRAVQKARIEDSITRYRSKK